MSAKKKEVPASISFAGRWNVTRVAAWDATHVHLADLDEARNPDPAENGQLRLACAQGETFSERIERFCDEDPWVEVPPPDYVPPLEEGDPISLGWGIYRLQGALWERFPGNVTFWQHGILPCYLQVRLVNGENWKPIAVLSLVFSKLHLATVRPLIADWNEWRKVCP